MIGEWLAAGAVQDTAICWLPRVSTAGADADGGAGRAALTVADHAPAPFWLAAFTWTS